MRTAMDVVGFATAKMPPPYGAQNGNVAREDYFAVAAFLLLANGRSLKDPLTPESAPTIPLH